jgi:hypothetical protein
MTRVTRPGGHVLAEFYNPRSIRGLLRRWGPAGRVANTAKESDVYTRFDTPDDVAKLTPGGTELVDSRGVRIVTPTAALMRFTPAKQLFRGAERALCDSPLRRYGGFYIAAFQKR